MSQIRIEVFTSEDEAHIIDLRVNRILQKDYVHFIELKELCGKVFLVYKESSKGDKNDKKSDKV